MIINKIEMPKKLLEQRIAHVIEIIAIASIFSYIGYIAYLIFFEKMISNLFTADNMWFHIIAVTAIFFEGVVIIQKPIIKRKEKASYLNQNYVYDLSTMDDSTDKEFVDQNIGKYAFNENGLFLEKINKEFLYKDIELFATYEELLRFYEKKNGIYGRMVKTPLVFIQIFAKTENDDDEFIVKLPLIKEMYYWIVRYRIGVRGLEENLTNIRSYVCNNLCIDLEGPQKQSNK